MLASAWSLGLAVVLSPRCPSNAPLIEVKKSERQATTSFAAFFSWRTLRAALQTSVYIYISC